MTNIPTDRGTWVDHTFLLNFLPSATTEHYNLYRGLNDASEHHIGRYLNMKAIANEIKENNISGDIVEFGTWQGLGLLFLSQCFRQSDRKFIGIDSFEGLPETSNGWVKGTFNDTSYNLALDNLNKDWPTTDHNYSLIQGWFNDPAVSEQLYTAVDKLALVHFDADLGSSTTQALSIIEPYLTNRKEPIYFLFDDWGIHPAEVPVAWHDWYNQAQEKFGLNAEEISATVYTKNFRITFN